VIIAPIVNINARQLTNKMSSGTLWRRQSAEEVPFRRAGFYCRWAKAEVSHGKKGKALRNLFSLAYD
jgi:hypothetical protein